MMKKLISVILAIVMLTTMAACGQSSSGGTDAAGSNSGTDASSGSGGESFHYIFGHGAAEGSIGDLYCLEFKRLVEEKSGGSVTVDVYSGSQLGTYGEMLQSLQTGDIGGMIFQPAPAVSFVPELAMLDLPYAFYGLSQAQIDHALNQSDYSALLNQSFEGAGYKFMSFAQAATFREVTSSKAINSIEDFKGLDIRTLENKYHLAFWKDVGANPTPVAFGELYLSLQQGLVSAQENPYDTAYAAGFQEVQDYVVNTHHILYPNLFIVNKALFESMPKEYQDAFAEAAEEAKAYAENEMKASAVADLDNLLNAGMDLIEFSDGAIADMASHAAVVEAMLRTDLGDEVVDMFLSSLGN